MRRPPERSSLIRSWRRLKSGAPFSSRATTSPSTIASRASIQLGGESSRPKYVSASLRFRVNSRTSPSRTTACTRNPSHLISNSQSGSSKALLVSVASIGSMWLGIRASRARDRSISASPAGAWLIQIASLLALTSSFVRPVLTLAGKSSASQPSVDSGPRLWMSSHCSESSSNGRPVSAPRRPPVRTIVNRPRSFSPLRVNLSSPSSIALRPSSVGASPSQVPQSQTITSPAPYCRAGMMPSKSK